MMEGPDVKARTSAVRLLWRQDLGLWARLSVAGLVVAAVLALALGWFIPRWVGDRFLETQGQADATVLNALSRTEALVVTGQQSEDADFSALDTFARDSILAGDFVRVKLWAPDGTILYSDESRIIGERFDHDHDFQHLMEPLSHRSDLTADENRFELAQFETGLLETYVPVRGDDGDLLAIWEVYRPLDEYDAAVASTRLAVRLSVGLGLALLAVFLVSVFGGLVASVQRRRREAESRSAELTTLLGIVRTTARTIDRDKVIEDTVRRVHADSDFECVVLFGLLDGGEKQVLAAEGPTESFDMNGGGQLDERFVEATTSVDSGSLQLVACAPVVRDRASSEALLQAAVEELGVATHRADLYEDLTAHRARLQDVMMRLVTAQDNERQRIVGEIHDGLGQDLYRVLYGIRGCLTAEPEEALDELARLESLVTASNTKLRRLLQELHPSVIEDIGLAASLRSLADRIHDQYDLHVELRQSHFSEPPLAVRVAMFRIAQEALQNIVKHSGTKAAWVTVASEQGVIQLEVEDHGGGIAEDQGDGLGMWLMRERAESLGGTLEVMSDEETTIIQSRIPVGED